MNDDLALYFGVNRDWLSDLHRRSGWRICWPGLLFPQAWFLYRKMFGWAALTTAGPLALLYLPTLAWTAWGASLIGAFGLTLYFRSAERAIAAIHAESEDAEDARTRIARAGGVSFFGGAVGALYMFGMFLAQLRLQQP